METASSRSLRVLMLSDDSQIDRRILQEAESLGAHGLEVLIAGKARHDLPDEERVGAVRVERLHNVDVSKAKRLLALIAQQLDLPHREAGGKIALDGAGPEFRALLRSAKYYVPDFPLWIESQGRLTRNLLKALVWPPLRLDLLRRYLPRMPKAVTVIVYLPTLLLTPVPAALRLHWLQLKPRVAAWLPERKRRLVLAERQQLAEAQRQLQQSRVERFADLNTWELALFERGSQFAPDVVHVHDLPQLRAGCFIARQLAIPCIYDAHELYPVIHTLRREQQERLSVIEQRFIQEVAHTITVNPFIARRMAEDYGVRLPTVILNAAPASRVARGEPRPDLLRDKMGLGSDARVLLFQGWISLDRQVGELVKAMVQVPERVHLVLLGYGGDLPALRRLAADLRLTTRVHFLDPVPQKELMRWVMSADAGVIPYQAIDDNHLYCSPNKLFEFIAAGIPVICNDLPFLRQVVAGSNFGVVRNLDTPAAFTAAISEMFDSRLGGESRFHRALDEKADPFLWPAQERTLLEVYTGLQLVRKGSADAGSLTPADGSRSSTMSVATTPAPLRIFHGLHNIAGIPSIMARAERKLGLDSTAVCFPKAGFGYQADVEEQPTTQRELLSARFESYANRYDVFVFHFGSSLAGESLADVPLLKRMGKRVIFYFHGCDVRDCDETIRKYEFSACKVCWPRRCNPNRQLAVEMAEKYADAVWVSTPDLLEFVPRSKLFPQPVELERFSMESGASATGHAVQESIRVVHAPSNSQLKGSRHVEAAASAIRDKGLPLELQLLQGLSHREMCSRMGAADIAVDQLLIGSYGTFAVEAMAMGIPVICYLRDDLVGLYPEPPPIMSATPLTIEQNIAAMIDNPELRQQLASAGRMYVQRHHSAEVCTRRSLAVYERICAVPNRSDAVVMGNRQQG